jgi:uncharacterized protein YukE
MMIAIMSVYLVLLFALVQFGIVAFNLFWKASPFIVLLLLTFGLFIPMGWGAPQGPALVVRNAVSIVPDVAGEVIEVPVQPNAALKAGDVLFRIDPIPYQAQVNAIEAQSKLAEKRLSQMTQLFERDAGRGFDVEQRQSEADQLRAQLENARWNLDKVETVFQAISTGQTQTSGLAVTPKEIQSAPFVVRVRLDDQELSKQLPAGSTGTGAIFTEAVKATHIIRKVLLRQLAILNYVNPF